ncbi:hypothetical protein PR003_g23762 [Phytophthora rubi]|uniref:Uncharacterized protein n=1 Tax=Phytophthora rubi TaxID=129364 RepID=A0A6A4CTQ0_9STRA|nr:hypothetical protein PR002_g23903 [Phytophthora rubi]KAE9005396.1 hypothetical protein PR001_g17463 [Phytophthora rubi]KAE9296421.1 hypothetical protein PR003_g23762 [Phytophthora rubi]
MAEAESGTSAGRSTPKRKGTDLNYMYATLGIEQDDSSDDDFVPDDADEAGDGDQVSDDSEELGRQGKMQATKGGKSSGNLSAAKDANRQQASLKRRFPPHEMRPSKKRRVVLEAKLVGAMTVPAETLTAAQLLRLAPNTRLASVPAST